MNCIECGIKLGANTIHKKWETCKRCRSKIKHKCIDCDEICNKENGRCLSCGIKNAHKNKNYGWVNVNKKTTKEWWLDKYGQEIAEKLWAEKYDNRRDYSGSGNPMYQTSVFDVWKEKFGEEKALEMWEERRVYFSNKYSSSGNPMYQLSLYDNWKKKFGEEIAEQKYDNWYSSLTATTSTQEHREKCRIIALNALKRPIKKNNVEKLVEQYLLDNKIDYKYCLILDKKYQYDFIVKDKKILIEVNGTYWHADPRFYNENNMNVRQKFKVSKDKEKREYAESKGFKLLYIWEEDINKKDFSAIKEIL